MISYSLVQRNDAKKLNEFSSEAIVPILSMKPTVLELPSLKLIYSTSKIGYIPNGNSSSNHPFSGTSVDGQNPAPPRMKIIPLFIGF